MPVLLGQSSSSPVGSAQPSPRLSVRRTFLSNKSVHFPPHSHRPEPQPSAQMPLPNLLRDPARHLHKATPFTAQIGHTLRSVSHTGSPPRRQHDWVQTDRMPCNVPVTGSQSGTSRRPVSPPQNRASASQVCAGTKRVNACGKHFSGISSQLHECSFLPFHLPLSFLRGPYRIFPIYPAPSSPGLLASNPTGDSPLFCPTTRRIPHRETKPMHPQKHCVLGECRRVDRRSANGRPTPWLAQQRGHGTQGASS